MILSINELIQFHKDIEIPRTERILWVDEGNIIAFTINISSEEALPTLRKVRELLEGLTSGEITRIDKDPHIRLVTDDDLDDKRKAIRDKAWGIVCMIADKENEPAIYYREQRGSLIRQAMDAFDVSKNMVYKYLRRYWQRGKNKTALIPDYDNSGGRGKEKAVGQKKRGRPRKHPELQGLGINVDDATKRIFRIAISQYYHNEKENALTVAYDFMIKDFYTGVGNAIKDSEVLPSFEQFKYWYEKERDSKKALIARKGEKKYKLQHRPVLGRSDSETIGPGSMYQIDATIGDIYLVSRYNRNWIIGRPIIYVVIDVFSRMITGIYVGLEGPSWVGAMMALANAAADKTTFCDEYGISITEEMWPCRYLPQTILADRGEMESKNVDKFIESLNIKVQNTPPYRADWKGIVEQYFRTINTKVKPLVPGFIDVDFRQRGGNDYRYDAKLDIYQFTQIIIKCVLHHNNENWMANYNKDEMMIADEVKPIPIELWKWGVANRSGILRTYHEDIIKLNLMPVDKATVTAKGIKYKKMLYSCDKAIQEMWFEKARNNTTWKVDISYDPRNLDFIYIRTPDGRSFDKCYMLDKNLYANKTYDEISYLMEYEKYEEKIQLTNITQSKVDLISDIDKIVKEAENMTNSQQDKSISKTAKVKNIRQNRKSEKEQNRPQEAFELEKSQMRNSNDNVILMVAEQEEDYNTADDIEFLLKKQEERLYGKDK